MAKVGAPAASPELKQQILEDILPYLRVGNSLNSAIYAAGRSSNRTLIYDLYQEDEEFKNKIDQAKSFLSRSINNVFGTRVIKIAAKYEVHGVLDTYDEGFLKWFALNSKAVREEYGEHKEITGKGGKPLVPSKVDDETIDEVTKKVAGMISNFEEYDRKHADESTPIPESTEPAL